MSALDSVVGFTSAKQPTALDLSLRVGGAISNHSITKLLCTKFNISATNSKKSFHFSPKTQKEMTMNLATIGQAKVSAVLTVAFTDHAYLQADVRVIAFSMKFKKRKKAKCMQTNDRRISARKYA